MPTSPLCGDEPLTLARIAAERRCSHTSVRQRVRTIVTRSACHGNTPPPRPAAATRLLPPLTVRTLTHSPRTTPDRRPRAPPRAAHPPPRAAPPAHPRVAEPATGPPPTRPDPAGTPSRPSPHLPSADARMPAGTPASTASPHPTRTRAPASWPLPGSARA